MLNLTISRASKNLPISQLQGALIICIRCEQHLLHGMTFTLKNYVSGLPSSWVMAKPFLHQKTGIHFKIMEIAPRTKERQKSGLALGRDWNPDLGSTSLSPSSMYLPHSCLFLQTVFFLVRNPSGLPKPPNTLSAMAHDLLTFSSNFWCPVERFKLLQLVTLGLSCHGREGRFRQ